MDFIGRLIMASFWILILIVTVTVMILALPVVIYCEMNTHHMQRKYLRSD